MVWPSAADHSEAATKKHSVPIRPAREGRVSAARAKHGAGSRLHDRSGSGLHQNSEEARELAMIAEVLEAYECKRWSDGKVPGGKG